MLVVQQRRCLDRLCTREPERYVPAQHFGKAGHLAASPGSEGALRWLVAVRGDEGRRAQRRRAKCSIVLARGRGVKFKKIEKQSAHVRTEGLVKRA
eukprot:5784200-Pleurochrysis_carterae.AAC.1